MFEQSQLTRRAVTRCSTKLLSGAFVAIFSVAAFAQDEERSESLIQTLDRLTKAEPSLLIVEANRGRSQSLRAAWQPTTDFDALVRMAQSVAAEPGLEVRTVEIDVVSDRSTENPKAHWRLRLNLSPADEPKESAGGEPDPATPHAIHPKSVLDFFVQLPTKAKIEPSLRSLMGKSDSSFYARLRLGSLDEVIALDSALQDRFGTECQLQLKRKSDFVEVVVNFAPPKKRLASRARSRAKADDEEQ